MPARTVSDVGSLPSVDAPPDRPARPVVTVTTAPSGLEGEGFPVRRAFAGVDLRRLDPFVHMDQMGAVDYGPGEPKGTPWHPHRGFETVTYMIDGTFQHQDSIGGGGLIRDGDTQWMTAGAGILHIERPPEEMVASGGLFHGIQLWVNLPAAAKRIPPRYQDIGGSAVGMGSAGAGGGLVRVIAGAVGSVSGPGRTHTPITLAHVSIEPSARVVLPWDPSHNGLVYALAGRGTVGVERAPLAGGQLAVLGAGETVVLQAADRQDGTSPTFEVLLLGGRPIGEPVVAYGPFVMNTRAEIAEAFEDYQAGRLGTVPAEHIGS
jgi:redox-sensitive bicupin YhaK (pirin superfamily)